MNLRKGSGTDPMNKTLYFTDITLGTGLLNQNFGSFAFLTMESLSVAASNLCKDCFCTDNTCYSKNVSDPIINRTISEVTVTDNPAPYTG